MSFNATFLKIGSALLTTAGLAGCSTQPAASLQSIAPAEEHEAPALVAAEPIETLCEDGEHPAFSGDVEDDFGLTISVCISGDGQEEDPVISIRSSGEGGGTVLSCQASSCDGIIEFEHYRRPRFTLLTLKWSENGGQQELIESYDAQFPGGEVAHSITHSWATKESIELGLEATPYSVIAKTEALSMLALDPFFSSKD